jgi:hypothetical protein
MLSAVGYAELLKMCCRQREEVEQKLEEAIDALSFVCDTICDCETISRVERHGSRADALADVAPEIVARCRHALGNLKEPRKC